MQSQNLTIMFTDMKGYTKRTSLNSRKEIAKLIAEQDGLVLPVVKRFGGRVVKTIGDAYMVVFESPTGAVKCGVKIQEAVAGKFKLRIGVNTGEVGVKDGDVFGEPVNLASRLESMAVPGRVYLTEAVFQAMNKNEVKVVEMGEKWFKGIPREVKIYKVALPGIRGRWEALWPIRYPKALPSFLLVLGLLMIEWGIYQWRWPEKLVTEAAKLDEEGEVLGEENELVSVGKGGEDLLREELLKLLRVATESGVVVAVTPEPSVTVEPSIEPSVTATPTVEPTPTEAELPRGLDKKTRDWDPHKN